MTERKGKPGPMCLQETDRFCRIVLLRRVVKRLDVSGVQAAAQISIMKQTMDQQAAASQKLLNSMEQVSAAINANSSAEPGKGQNIDVRC